MCKLNYHYHPEIDGWYLAGSSHGRCYVCDKLIKKCEDYVWREVEDDKENRT